MEERLLPINEILPGVKDWKCRVRVIKKLAAKQASNSPNKFQKLILGDGLGCTLDAVIFHDNIDRFEHVLQEGRVYMVKGAHVSDPKQYKNPIVTCNYQWTFRRDTSVMEEPDDSIPACGLCFRTTPSCEFHKYLSTKTLINNACIIIAKQEPRVVTVRGQGKVLREYAAIDTELEPFVVTFWEDSISDEMYARMEPASKRTPLLLINFSVVPYYGLSLSSNAQSIVVDDSNDELLIELERWKRKNEQAINILVQSANFFEKKVLRSPKQPLQATTVEQILHTQENTYFNVKVKARLENEYQDFFYIGCPICSTKTAAIYGTEFMCYSTPCKTMRIATRSFRFTLVVFDATGEAEVTFLGKEAQKLLGLDPIEFHQKQNETSMAQSDFLRKRLSSVVLLLKIKSRIFKDVPTFTVDAIEILQNDSGTPLEQTSTRRNDSLEKGPLTIAKKLTFHDSSDNENTIQVKIANKDKGKEKIYEESNVEHKKENAIRSTLEDSNSSDDGKPISEIFKGKKRNVFVVHSEDSENDSFDYAMESAQKDKHGVMKKRTQRKPISKRKKIMHLDLTQDDQAYDDQWSGEDGDSSDKSEQILANDEQWFNKDGDSSDHSKHISDTAENFSDASSDMPLSSEILKKKKKDQNIVQKTKTQVDMNMKDSGAGTLHQEKKKKPKLVAVTPKKTKVAQAKNNQVSTALSTKDDKKVKFNISKNKKEGLLAVSQTPQLKSRSGRTIKQRILD